MTKEVTLFRRHTAVPCALLINAPAPDPRIQRDEPAGKKDKSGGSRRGKEEVLRLDCHSSCSLLLILRSLTIFCLLFSFLLLFHLLLFCNSEKSLSSLSSLFQAALPQVLSSICLTFVSQLLSKWARFSVMCPRFLCSCPPYALPSPCSFSSLGPVPS